MLTDADWASLLKQLTKSFGDDAAQHALMRLIERQLLSEGVEGAEVNDPFGYCLVVAQNYIRRQHQRDHIYVSMAEPQHGEEYVPPVFREDVTPERVVSAKELLTLTTPELRDLTVLRDDARVPHSDLERQHLSRERINFREKVG